MNCCRRKRSGNSGRFLILWMGGEEGSVHFGNGGGKDPFDSKEGPTPEHFFFFRKRKEVVGSRFVRDEGRGKEREGGREKLLSVTLSEGKRPRSGRLDPFLHPRGKRRKRSSLRRIAETEMKKGRKRRQNNHNLLLGKEMKKERISEFYSRRTSLSTIFSGRKKTTDVSFYQ